MSVRWSLLGAALLLVACDAQLAPSMRRGTGPGPGIVDSGTAPRSDAGGLTGDSGTFVPPPDAAMPRADAMPPMMGITWKGILMSGDDSITAFDSARKTLAGIFSMRGLSPANTIQLSRDSGEQTGGVRDTSVEGFEQALRDLSIGPNDGCLIHITSHGNSTGFFIRDREFLTPSDMARILDATCGQRPTVVLISACYSGVFVDPVAAPNRVILTAAREDRSSFGCGTEDEYTYWDGCLIDELPGATTWRGLYDSIVACIERKESGGFTPSEPQGSFGATVMSMSILQP